ncbi:putative cellulase [Medicago truncatula]|uniref:Cellulase (Glycosyl hydrolase family 5) n=1 Tax=Medicago truncatula TaxID=3880 RepID=A0A072TTI4_MEDTR|nr:glycosyl hydrolase 5 family protein [Medicago truncatula]KEH20742.1 cellulase (glycosyl hydrolase family 5) [Medicago truncatula]RHN42840.1 putative cellulase [Medicago truncatula]
MSLWRCIMLILIGTIILELNPVVAVKGVPLGTSSRWIVNQDGERVKLACLNWVSHLDAVVAEGLSKKPVDVISNGIKSMGFNCVRLTWPILLLTNDTLSSLTVRQSFQNLGLLQSVAAFQSNNPSIIDVSLIQAFQAVVKSLGDNDVMVILDNHITQPGWCCSNSDGNGFFGDQYFDPNLWIQGLTKMATLFNGVSNVVGMSLRNELRGPKQNVNDWYRYMVQGAEAVHAANPDVLVILSGLNFDKDLSYIAKRPVNLTFKGKLVFEAHWYAFTDGQAWASGNPNQVCGQVAGNMKRMSGYLVDQGWPLFVSEFGVDLRGTNVNDNRYLNCFIAYAAELDLDWALWTLVGSYYFRQGVIGMEEFYGIFNWDWTQVRNASFLQRIASLQLPFQGPGITVGNPHKLLFHPSTGLCVIRKSLLEPLKLDPCSLSDGWNYTPQKILSVKGTYFCIQAVKEGMPATLSILCSNPNSKWDMISDSKLHLSSKINSGSTNVCLDVNDNNIIVTNACKCLSNDHSCDPGSQWFKLIDSGRRSISSISTLSELNLLELFMKPYLTSK